MEIRKLIFIIVLLMLFSAALFAQAEPEDMQGEEIELANAEEELEEEEEEEELFYYLEQTDDGWRFIQRIVWDGAEFVTRYVVIIEKMDDGIYSEAERIETEDTFIEVSLQAGDYRYQIEVYDIFNELSFISNWQEFQVIRALQPEIASFSPAGFFLDENENWVINLRGRNILQDSVIYLVRGNTRITPANFTVERNAAQLVFSEVSLIPGEYDIFIRNPGGLETIRGTFIISYKKPIDINLSLLYAPIIPISGVIFKDTTVNAPFPDSVYPLSFGAKASFIPFKRPWGNLGAEVSGSFSFMQSNVESSASQESFTSKGQLINSHINLLYQFYFYKRTLALNAGFGGGITALTNFYYDYSAGNTSEKFGSYYFSFIGSLSFTAFVYKSYFVNLSVDYIHLFSAAKDNKAINLIRPTLALGIQL